jgi:hypothetical protein
VDALSVVAGEVSLEEARVQWRDIIRQFGACGVAKQKIAVLLLHEESGIIDGIRTRARWRRWWWIAIGTLDRIYLCHGKPGCA